MIFSVAEWFICHVMWVMWSLPFILFFSLTQLHQRLGNLNNIYICMVPLNFQSIFTMTMSSEPQTQLYLCAESRVGVIFSWCLW